MKRMKVHILAENVAGATFLAEHGLSYLIEIDNTKILFDTGHSDVFLKNARSLGFNIQKEVNKVVLSHGHWDHGNGLKFIEDKTLITHPGSFISRFRKKDHSPIGLKMTKTEIQNKFNLQEFIKPIKVTENLIFLGEIPRQNNFEGQQTPFELTDGRDDFIPDDSALVATLKDELVIISGCSHSGICNICNYAQKVTGIKKIKAVMGGFHLKNADEQTTNTVKYFRKEGVKSVFPSHCTELPALSAFYMEFKIRRVKTGMTFDFSTSGNQ